MVMDVMAAAARIEAAGGHVIHMEVGQPSAPAPRTGDRGRAAALEHGRIDYTAALGIPSLRHGSRDTTASSTAATWTPSGSS